MREPSVPRRDRAGELGGNAWALVESDPSQTAFLSVPHQEHNLRLPASFRRSALRALHLAEVLVGQRLESVDLVSAVLPVGEVIAIEMSAHIVVVFV